MTVSDQMLAARYQPQLMLDEHEPYQPYAYGWTIFREPGQSPSSKFAIAPTGAFAVEYAIFYDWDIGHLYDLEHIWVHVAGDGAVVKVEASSHGGRKPMDIGNGLPAMQGEHAIIYAEAGKHAHWASPEHMNDADRQKLAFLCSTLAGIEGVHLGNPFAEAGAYTAGPEDHNQARSKMEADAFVPTHRYAAATPPKLLTWPDLAADIPRRVTAIMADLRTVSLNG